MVHSYNQYKDLFILEDGLTYLNCANMSPMLRSVKEAGLQAIDKRAAPWNISGDDWFANAEKLRSLVAQVFQTNSNNVALIPSASYGLAAAAKNIKLSSGKEIIVLEQQFPSNYYVWENLASEQNLQIVTIKKSEDKSLTESIVESINASTGLVAIPNCHWMDGTLIDLQKVSDAAKIVGAYLVLDLSQSLGVLPIDIESIKPDFAVSVGYKWLLGPYGLGYMYVAEKWQEEGEPLEYSWITKKGSEDFSGLSSYVTGYRDGARKFDMGGFPQFHILPMAIPGVEQLLEWQVDTIQSEIKKLTGTINNFKKDNGLLAEAHINVGHITSIPFSSLNVNAIKSRLKESNVVISFRGESIRVSPHLYNNVADVDRLLDCLK